MYVVNGVVKIEFHFAHGGVVVGGAKHDHAELDFIVCIDLAVDDEAIQLGKFGNGAHEGGNDDGKMAGAEAAFSGVQHIIVHVFIRDGDGDRILCITAIAHKIGRKGMHGVYVLYSFSICSHVKNVLPECLSQTLYAILHKNARECRKI